jgi:drug/metabolite transporter (DMT)-like permease
LQHIWYFSGRLRAGNGFADEPTAVLYALLSAVLFGVSTPVAKLLVGSIDPITLAGLLYCVHCVEVI